MRPMQCPNRTHGAVWTLARGLCQATCGLHHADHFADGAQDGQLWRFRGASPRSDTAGCHARGRKPRLPAPPLDAGRIPVALGRVRRSRGAQAPSAQLGAVPLDASSEPSGSPAVRLTPQVVRVAPHVLSRTLHRRRAAQSAICRASRPSPDSRARILPGTGARRHATLLPHVGARAATRILRASNQTQYSNTLTHQLWGPTRPHYAVWQARFDRAEGGRADVAVRADAPRQPADARAARGGGARGRSMSGPREGGGRVDGEPARGMRVA